MKGGTRARVLARLQANPGTTLRFERAERAAVEALAAAGVAWIVEQPATAPFAGGIYAKLKERP